jgi:hypothetical protein
MTFGVRRGTVEGRRIKDFEVEGIDDKQATAQGL